MTPPKTTKIMTRNSILSLRKLVLAIIAITFVFAFSACNNKDNENVQRFKDAASNLDNTHHTLVDEFDYWPECGIRVMGSHLASLISLTELQEMLPCPLYVSGPHHDGKWDLENENDFGHYNPKAIQYLADLAKKVVSDKNFVKLTKPLVDEYLYRQMRIMMVLHDAVYDEELCPEDYRENLFNEMIETNGYGDDAFYIQAVLDLEDGSYVYSNTSDRFLYFWARRWKDGTIDQFYQALSTVYKAYYPEYEYHLYDYFMEEGDYWEGDWEEEFYFYPTEYNIELEPDEPVTDEERFSEDEGMEYIMGAVLNLDNSTNVLEYEYDDWPNGTLRITASHLFSMLSLRTLNRILPCDLYVSGPHHYNHWEFNCSYDFGRYNPDAIQYLDKLASKIVADKKFVQQTKPLVDKYLKKQMFTMKAIYEGLDNKELCADKQEILVNSMECEGHTYDNTVAGKFLYNLPGYNDEDNNYCYEIEMCLYWWARRNADDTMDLFYHGLKTVYDAYYPEE